MLKYTQMLSLLKERGKMENIINNTEEKMMNAITTLENR